MSIDQKKWIGQNSVCGIVERLEFGAPRLQATFFRIETIKMRLNHAGIDKHQNDTRTTTMISPPIIH